MAPTILFKKIMMLLWAEFGERFGMPLAKARTNTRDLNAVIKLENFLRQMASKSYAIIDNAEDLEFIESVKSDSYNVFDKMIERCNSEMSKAIRLQTLTGDAGNRGARSLGEVHLLADEDVAEYNRDYISDLINETLLPQLAQHGFATEGRYFQYVIAKQVSDEQHRQDVWLDQHFEIDPEFWAERYGVPIRGRRQQPGALPANDVPDANDRQMMGAASILKLHADLHQLYHQPHHHCTDGQGCTHR
ncbi:phage portal protein family protein [Thermaurantimonas aggregans]